MAEVILKNETPQSLSISMKDGASLVMAPLEEHTFEYDLLDENELVAQKARREVSVEATSERAGAETVVPGGLTALVAFVSLTAAVPASYRALYLWGGGLLLVAGLIAALAITWKGRGVVIRRILQLASLSVILAIGIALPAFVILVFGSGYTLLLQVLNQTALQGPVLADTSNLAVIGRCLQLLFMYRTRFLGHTFKLGRLA